TLRRQGPSSPFRTDAVGPDVVSGEPTGKDVSRGTARGGTVGGRATGIRGSDRTCRAVPPLVVDGRCRAGTHRPARGAAPVGTAHSQLRRGWRAHPGR